jgi:hypothetical protein
MIVASSFELSDKLTLILESTDEEAFIILFACAILFYNVERLGLLYLYDFMGLSLVMSSSETLENFEKCAFRK